MPANRDRRRRPGRLGAVVAVSAMLLVGGCASLPDGARGAPSQALAVQHDTALAKLTRASTEDAALSGFRLLSWSAQAFDARIELARRAERSLDVQYYVLHNDDTGRMLLRALRDAAGRGVRVRLLVDDLHSAGSEPLLLGLAAHPNVEVRLFNPFPVRAASVVGRFAASLPNFARLNRRMHNKLFIADGTMAIAGGRNVGDEYFMVHSGSNYIDLDVFAIGAVLPRLGVLFDAYWNSRYAYPVQALVRSDEPAATQRTTFEAATRIPPGRGPQPPPPGSTDLLGQRSVGEEMAEGRLALVWAAAEAFADSPDKVVGGAAEGGAPAVSVRKSLMTELLLARREVLITSPYLVPDRTVMEDIAEGRLWNLSITLVTNSLASTDEPIVHAGYERYRRGLIDLGVKLYEVAPSRAQRSANLGSFGQSVGRFHAKTAAIDGERMFIGSLNFDPRSEKHNTELGLLIESRVLTKQLMRLAETVKDEAAYRVRLGEDGGLEWHIGGAGGPILYGEPETSWWRRAALRLIGPFVPEGQL